MKKLIFVFLLFPALVLANNSVTVTQYDGDKDCNYIIDVNGIAKIADVNEEPDAVYETGIDVKRAVAFGQSDILIFANDEKIYSFNTIIKRLRELDRPDELTVEMESTLTEAQAIDMFGVGAVQHDGFENRIYIIDANGITKIRDIGQEAEKVYETGIDVRSAVAFGQSDIALFAKDDSVFSFHTITKTLRPLPRPEELTVEMESTLTVKQAVKFFGTPQPEFGILNYSVLGLYLVSLLGMGFYFSKSEKSTKDFFLGGKRIPAWAAGLSLFGTNLSAITFMAIPAKVYATNWHYFTGNITILIIAAPVGVLLFIPFFCKLNITTAYEYLEKRFNIVARLCGSFMYAVMHLLKMGIVLLLPALALSTVTGMNVNTTILVMGVLCTVYTVLGGIKAVIWTDVLQVIVLLIGAVVCIVIIIFDLGENFIDMTGAAFAQGKFSPGQLGWDLTAPTLFVVLLGTSAQWIGSGDQNSVQRYLTTRNVKEAQKSLWISAFVSVPAAFLFFTIGTLLYMYYGKNPANLNAGMDNDTILPWFILQQLPAGVSGVIIAGIFAAAMSSLDSSMNGIASAIVTDTTRFKPSIPEDTRLVLARVCTCAVGIVGTVIALILAAGGFKSLFDALSIIASPFGGCLGGLFMLGAISKRANGTGAILGVITGFIVTYYVQFGTPLHFILYVPIAAFSTLGTGYIFSLLTGGNQKDITGLALGTKVKKGE